MAVQKKIAVYTEKTGVLIDRQTRVKQEYVLIFCILNPDEFYGS